MIFPGIKNCTYSITVGTNVIKCSDVVKLLGVNIDSQLTFYPHIKEVCKKASQKTKALLRVRSCLSQSQADVLINSYILSAFNYCPLVWMFCSKKAHDLINSTHRRALSAKVNKFSFPLNVLLRNTNSVSIHARNLRLLVCEVYMTLNRLNPELNWNTFEVRDSGYDLRRVCSLKLPRFDKLHTSKSPLG